ncbi:Transglutaminase-like superfamily protein [Evansella caseinilytica]|uniref:Transglutaminase-like superfamily protein n=1 Tax=Evansella caseinilytica TaxID=1503961 RepID=A0A1H3QBE2_9BACI|nr:transglutaminase-like domain-containing protein [Evansella caseinilytica]SDZ10593.1 Transglutaminase-like superfamily protein [Evansella caseinilytica]
MKQRSYYSFILAIVLLALSISGCAEKDGEAVKPAETDAAISGEATEGNKGEPIEYTGYAEEIGFVLDAPAKTAFETNTTMDIRGQIGEFTELTGDNLWIVVSYENQLDDIRFKDFEYYLPLENGKFSQEITLHHGAGEYSVTVRAPSNKQGEENLYYDTVVLDVANLDEEIQRDVEYTWHGIEQGISVSSAVSGMNEANGFIYLEGAVPPDYPGTVMMISIEKDSESQQIFLPVKNGVFAGDVPLYFGEGYHDLVIQTYDREESYYYKAAHLYVDNQADEAFAEIELFRDYMERGVVLDEPSWAISKVQNEIAYRVAGELDSSVKAAEDISHLIVTVTKTGEDPLESSYVIPVENGRFDGQAYFRFGPGSYEVNISVPDVESGGSSTFYFSSLKKVAHEVTGIEDRRDTLPSRGIESDHPDIIAKAKEITAGLTDEREFAKAVYQFTASHIVYDVDKLEAGTFDLADSALKALETGRGVCQDYSYLAVALLRASGMEAHYVEGYAGEPHAWVEVKVNGEWLEMDPTWGSGYIQDGVFVPSYNEQYFDPDPEFLAETHSRDGIVY